MPSRSRKRINNITFYHFPWGRPGRRWTMRRASSSRPSVVVHSEQRAGDMGQGDWRECGM